MSHISIYSHLLAGSRKLLRLTFSENLKKQNEKNMEPSPIHALYFPRHFSAGEIGSSLLREIR